MLICTVFKMRNSKGMLIKGVLKVFAVGEILLGHPLLLHNRRALGPSAWPRPFFPVYEGVREEVGYRDSPLPDLTLYLRQS